MLQKSNSIVNELAKADITFTHTGTFVRSLPANSVKNFAISSKNELPGGWPTSNLYEVAINSPQSQKLAVGSIVNKYTKEAIAKITQPEILFRSLNCFIWFVF